MKKIFLSVVIPAYNEEENIKKGKLLEVSNFLSKKNFSWEVLVVDDGSQDKTFELASEFGKKYKNFKVFKEIHRGKGGTIIAGAKKAKGEIVLFTDMDQATPIREVEKFLPFFKKGYDIVIGSRAGRKGAPLIRKLMAYGFSFLRLLILRLPFKDTQCGFKAFRKEVIDKIFKKMSLYRNIKNVKGASVSAGFDLELLFIAKEMGFKIKEVPVFWHHKTTKRVNPIKDSWRGFKDLVKIKLNSLRGVYK